MPSARQTVLIVDDLPVNIAFASTILEEECNTLTTSNGEDAIRLAIEHQPDLILLDILMPGMNGFEVCRRLKADPRTRAIPVIFLTSLSKEEDEERGLWLGAIDYITKPFSSPVVRARVRNHLELRRQRDLLERLSNVDGLTGIANRRLFDKCLQREWLRCQRQNDPLALLMIDVDLFKAYNDGYGHLAGDECLKRVASALAHGLARATDVIARYGGEEFACILPVTYTEGAALVGEQLRAAVASLAIPHAFSTVTDHVTVSIGGCAVFPSPAITSTEFLATADQQLYEAKHGGRDRVCVTMFA